MLGQDHVGAILLYELVEDGANQVLGVLAVGRHVLHHHGHVDVLGRVPAVVVGRHADHLVRQLGLARQLGLGQHAHVDDGAAPRAVHVALGARAELGALHADDGALVVQDDAVAAHGGRALLNDGAQLGVERVRETDVANDAALEEGEGAHALGPVDDLVRDDKVHRLDLLAQGADGGEGDDGAHADGAQGGDVGARVDLVRRDLVVDAVAGEEGDGDARVLEDHDGARGLAPGGVDVERGDGSVAIDLVEAGAADDGDADGLCMRGRVIGKRGMFLRQDKN